MRISGYQFSNRKPRKNDYELIKFSIESTYHDRLSNRSFKITRFTPVSDSDFLSCIIRKRLAIIAHFDIPNGVLKPLRRCETSMKLYSRHIIRNLESEHKLYFSASKLGLMVSSFINVLLDDTILQGRQEIFFFKYNFLIYVYELEIFIRPQWTFNDPHSSLSGLWASWSTF